jgi:DNA/RNA-binding domain of Phe-tRNA-synthetase-like protein
MRFVLDPAVHELGVRGVYFNIRGMINVSSSELRIREFVAQQLAEIPADMEKSEVLHGFSYLHRKVSDNPEKLMASSANLLSFFRSRANIPRINGIVDVYNAISIKSGLAIGAHDLSRVNGDIELRLTLGNENFTPLGAAKPMKIPRGEYAYVDSNNDILCRLEVRQVEKTRITLDSSDVFFIVQGHDHIAPSTIHEHAQTLQHACRRFFGGELEPLNPH